MKDQVLSLLLCCIVPLAVAVRSGQISEHVNVQNRTALAFECPNFCQECCDATTVLGGARFKCVLKDGITHYTQKCRKDKAKEHKQEIRDIVEAAGYTCSSLERRKATNEQWKIDCKYKLWDEAIEKPDPERWKCSKDMECCCNKEADFVERRCVDPNKDDQGNPRVWYKFYNFRAVVDPRTEITKEEAEKLIQENNVMETPFTLVDGEVYRGNAHFKDTHNAKIEIKNGQWRANVDSACQDESTPPLEYYHQVEKGAPVRGEGCCLEHTIDNFVWFDPDVQMEKFPKCTLFEALPYCPAGQLYMERVGRRMGMCFGTESTLETITHSYGAGMSTPNVYAKGIRSDWESVIAEARSKVEAKTRRDIRGRDEVYQQCPSGWESGSFQNGGGSSAMHGCECDYKCGRIPDISLAFMSCS